MHRYQRGRRGSRIGRLIVISLVLYGLYHWYFKQEASPEFLQVQPEPISKHEQLLHQQQMEDSSGLFSMIFSLIGMIPSFIWTVVTSIFGLFWLIIQKIWLVKVIWIILMSIVNVAFICFAYFLMKRQQIYSYIKFSLSLAIMVIIPLLINRFLVHQILAYYIFLPIDLTLFVDSQGGDAMFYYTMPRNLVFFVMACSLI